MTVHASAPGPAKKALKIQSVYSEYVGIRDELLHEHSRRGKVRHFASG